MTTALISQHSSNPFEATSSDPRNFAYKKAVTEAGARHDAERSSDDELSAFSADPAQNTYWKHIGEVVPGVLAHQERNYGKKAPTRTNRMVPRPEYVDLDDEMDSEDELTLRARDPEDRMTEDADSDGQGDEEMDVDADEDELEILSSMAEDGGIASKDPQERREIEDEINDLNQKIPQLSRHYKLLDRLGTGTFSSVYKAVDLSYHKWFNDAWHGHHPPASSAHYQSIPHPRTSKVYVAIKRIYVTSSPERIRNEIAIMNDCRACRHVSQLITAFRNEDQVVAIMPYQKNDDYRDFFTSLPIAGIKTYFRCLLRALRDIHARGIIHRDVKPANFLYDPRTGIGTLCDFGLASRIEERSGPSLCLHTPADREHPHGILRPRTEYDVDEIKKLQLEARERNRMPADRVGYRANDMRPHSKANRAGTRGFRAPEVLFKCSDQTGAIDVWSAGVILLFFLSRKFPLFQSNDDVEALMEIAVLVGLKEMEKVATLHNRTFSSNVPALTKEGTTWRTFCSRQNETLEEPPAANLNWFPHATTSTSKREHLKDLDSAFDLLKGLLHPQSIYRLTPRAALYHPFLREEQEDDHFFPHPFGEGICGDYHHKDESGQSMIMVLTGEQNEMKMRSVENGQGIAIGTMPCEFHQDLCP